MPDKIETLAKTNIFNGTFYGSAESANASEWNCIMGDLL